MLERRRTGVEESLRRRWAKSLQVDVKQTPLRRRDCQTFIETQMGGV